MELINGEYYTFNTEMYQSYPFIVRVGHYHLYPENKYYFKYKHTWEGGNTPINPRPATEEEIQWLEACKKAGKYIKKPEFSFEIY